MGYRLEADFAFKASLLREPAEKIRRGSKLFHEEEVNVTLDDTADGDIWHERPSSMSRLTASRFAVAERPLGKHSCGGAARPAMVSIAPKPTSGWPGRSRSTMGGA